MTSWNRNAFRNIGPLWPVIWPVDYRLDDPVMMRFDYVYVVVLTKLLNKQPIGLDAHVALELRCVFAGMYPWFEIMPTDMDR